MDLFVLNLKEKDSNLPCNGAASQQQCCAGEEWEERTQHNCHQLPCISWLSFFSCHTHLFGFPSSRTLPWPFYLRRGLGAQREAGWRKQRWWFFAFCFLFNYYFFNITILLQTLLFQVSAMALLFISHSLHLALLTLFFFSHLPEFLWRKVISLLPDSKCLDESFKYNRQLFALNDGFAMSGGCFLFDCIIPIQDHRHQRG